MGKRWCKQSWKTSYYFRSAHLKNGCSGSSDVGWRPARVVSLISFPTLTSVLPNKAWEGVRFPYVSWKSLLMFTLAALWSARDKGLYCLSVQVRYLLGKSCVESYHVERREGEEEVRRGEERWRSGGREADVMKRHKRERPRRSHVLEEHQAETT